MPVSREQRLACTAPVLKPAVLVTELSEDYLRPCSTAPESTGSTRRPCASQTCLHFQTGHAEDLGRAARCRNASQTFPEGSPGLQVAASWRPIPCRLVMGSEKQRPAAGQLEVEALDHGAPLQHIIVCLLSHRLSGTAVCRRTTPCWANTGAVLRHQAAAGCDRFFL